MRTATTAIAIESSVKRRTPQPIEPNSHSPTNSDEPIVTSRTAKIARAIASADERGELLDLLEDLGELGLGQLDVGHRQADAGVLGRAQLFAQARPTPAPLAPRWR